VDRSKRERQKNMRFASFMKSEVEEVGKVAMDIHLPFDQGAILEASMRYIKARLQIEELDILKLDTAEGVSERIADQVMSAISPTCGCIKGGWTLTSCIIHMVIKQNLEDYRTSNASSPRSHRSLSFLRDRSGLEDERRHGVVSERVPLIVEKQRPGD
jgi:hypothetical protein